MENVKIASEAIDINVPEREYEYRPEWLTYTKEGHPQWSFDWCWIHIKHFYDNHGWDIDIHAGPWGKKWWRGWRIDWPDFNCRFWDKSVHFSCCISFGGIHKHGIYKLNLDGSPRTYKEWRKEPW